MVAIAKAQTMVVRMSTGRIPHRPIQRLVSGPAIACPTLSAASTRPAAPYESKMRSMWMSVPSESIPPGKRARSWARRMRATPGTLSNSPYDFTAFPL